MKELFDDIGKKLPYNESETYLDGLVDEMTEKAIMQHHQTKNKMRWRTIAVSTAASVLIIIGIGTTLHHQRDNNNAVVTLNAEGPFDEFLNTLSDEEVAMLPDYEIEEIPEY